MKISHLKEAAVVTALIGVTWGGPQLFAMAVPQPEAEKTSNKPVVLGQGTETAEFTVPAGWNIEPRKADSAVTLSSDDGAVIDIRINDGGFNDDNSLERTLLNLNREGTSAVWEGAEFRAPALLDKGGKRLDLAARKCSVIAPATVDSPALGGDCVVAAGEGLSVSIVALGPGAQAPGSTDAESAGLGNGASPVDILKSAVIHRDEDSSITDPDVDPTPEHDSELTDRSVTEEGGK